jgi:SNF2-related domain/SNF2 Helicase protein/Helicase conserved C-terminal domain
MPHTPQLEAAIWAIVDGRHSDGDVAMLHADEQASLVVLDRLIVDAEDRLASVRRLPGEEREQVVADFTSELDALLATAARLRPEPEPEPEPRDEVQLQASWSAGQVVVWAAARGAEPEPNEALAQRLEEIGGPPVGWQLHAGVPLPGGVRADAVSIPMRGVLGWLVAVGTGQGGTGVAPSARWLGRVAIEGVRLVAHGSIVPTLRLSPRQQNSLVDTTVRWVPALLDDRTVGGLASAMPPTVTALGGGDARATTIAVLTAAVEAIVTESVERMELPAMPPRAGTPTDLADTIIARLDGSVFAATPPLAAQAAKRIEQWSRTVTSTARPRLVVRLDAPGPGGVWLVSVHAPTPKGELIPIDAALRTDRGSRMVTAEWVRLGRLLPALDRAGVRHRGQVALSQDEAWDFMSRVGPTVAAAGFDVRAPTISRRKATPSLRLLAESEPGTIVGAQQLADVTWSVLFDDVELSADDVARLARQARPLVQSQGRWVEIDRLELQQAAAALAQRQSVTRMTGAEILRHTIGLESSGLRGGVVVHGESWASDILRRAAEASDSAVTRPEGFVGELRTYQAEALGWIGFLEAAELGGCLALDMGLGKTPTVLAQLARNRDAGTSLVIAPAAVVGNWAAEAARFVPDVRVVVHHGATRATAEELDAELAGADMVITTYATAVRDIDALADRTWARIVLDEAQAIKNSSSETAQQLRRLTARTRLALTGTPIENGLGDLWSILDFTNPGLVGTRPTFLAQMAGDGDAALRALNGILLFRRTKAEPEVAAELPDKIDELDHCTMTAEQIGMYQAVLDELLAQLGVALLSGDREQAAEREPATERGADADRRHVGADADRRQGGADADRRQGAILAAITALKQICNHPAAYRDDGRPLAGRSGKLARLEELVESVFAAGERVLIFTHFASWGRRLAAYLTEVTGEPIACYDGSLARGQRDKIVADFQAADGPGALVLSLKAGGTGLNLTAANHVVLYDRWWNPAVEDQARDRAWRIGQDRTVISHRLVCPGTVDERVEEVVAGKRHIADLVLPRSSSLSDLDAEQLRVALGLNPDEVLAEDDTPSEASDEPAERRADEMTGVG